MGYTSNDWELASIRIAERCPVSLQTRTVELGAPYEPEAQNLLDGNNTRATWPWLSSEETESYWNSGEQMVHVVDPRVLGSYVAKRLYIASSFSYGDKASIGSEFFRTNFSYLKRYELDYLTLPELFGDEGGLPAIEQMPLMLWQQSFTCTKFLSSQLRTVLNRSESKSILLFSTIEAKPSKRASERNPRLIPPVSMHRPWEQILESEMMPPATRFEYVDVI
eukprot:294476-Amphidinium_carterae.1